MEHIVISAIGENNPNAISELFLLSAKNDCNIEETRLAAMGAEIAITMLISGAWNAIAKIEAGLENLKENFILTAKRTKLPQVTEETPALLPYVVELVAINEPGLIYEIVNFFVRQTIAITNLQTNTYTTLRSISPMLSLRMQIGLPAELSIASFREQFALFCDDLNLDGVLEPEKP